MTEGSRQELSDDRGGHRLLLQDSRAGANTAHAVLGGREEKPHPGDLQADAECHPCCPERVQELLRLHSPYQGGKQPEDTGERESIQTESSHLVLEKTVK